MNYERCPVCACRTEPSDNPKDKRNLYWGHLAMRHGIWSYQHRFGNAPRGPCICGFTAPTGLPAEREREVLIEHIEADVRYHLALVNLQWATGWVPPGGRI